jgi:predicted RNA-binding protein with PUA-like domain
VKKISQTQNRYDPKKTKKNPPWNTVVKATSTENKKRILKAEREKNQRTYKGKPKKLTDFSTQILKARRA